MLAANVSMAESSRAAGGMTPTVKTDVGTRHLTKYVQNLKKEAWVQEKVASVLAEGEESRGSGTGPLVAPRVRQRALYAERSLVSKRPWS